MVPRIILGAIVGGGAEWVSQMSKGERTNCKKILLNVVIGAFSMAIPSLCGLSKMEEILVAATYGNMVALGTGTVSATARSIAPKSSKTS